MSFERVGFRTSGAGLEIDLDAVADNYRFLQTAVAPAAIAGVVKADAYGLGATEVSGALVRAGCRHLFVANLDEALALLPSTPPAVAIYVLNGLAPGSEGCAADAGLIPVLNTHRQVEAWRHLSTHRREPLSAILHVDSGMSRLGLSEHHIAALAREPRLFQDLDVRYLMTHLACADEPDAASNAAQLVAFRRRVEALPPRPLSIANSAAALSGFARPDDLVRVGLALYGGAPLTGRGNPMRPVAHLTVRVLQVRGVPEGIGVGYGLTHVMAKAGRIATIEAGYADGWPRALGNRGGVYWGDRRLPIIGQVSMDSMTVDISELPVGALIEGDSVELIGPHQSLEAVAQDAGTISYEILTRLGRRFARLYAARGTTRSGSET